MTKIQLLNDLDKSGMLTTLIKCGLITPTLFTWHNVYLKHDIHIRTGKTSGDAEFLTAQEFKISERYVRKILREMKR